MMILQTVHHFALEAGIGVRGFAMARKVVTIHILQLAMLDWIGRMSLHKPVPE